MCVPTGGPVVNNLPANRGDKHLKRSPAREQPPLSATRGSPHSAVETQHGAHPPTKKHTWMQVSLASNTLEFIHYKTVFSFFHSLLYMYL